METALESPFLTVEEYLSGEEASEIRHEYIGGVVYAMAGVSDAHNSIAANILVSLHPHLRGKNCRAFISDVKVHLSHDDKDIFYYPDLMVACDPRDTNAYFKKYPKVIIEVLSDSTERTDRTEKFWSYTHIETLEEYVLVRQEKMEVTVFRRSRKWNPEIVRGAEQDLSLDSLSFKMALRAIYEGVEAR